jgi:hypothetical protein
MSNLKLTFTDTFSKCIEHKTISVTESDKVKIYNSLNKIVHRELKKDIVYIWELTKIEVI